MSAPALAATPAPDAPIVFFLPAFDEEASIAGVLARMPSSIGAHPVRVVVIDDGSADATAAVARAAARSRRELATQAPERRSRADGGSGKPGWQHG